jgi:inositol phosphorylceramide mannosyltransferase catalytic subunit
MAQSDFAGGRGRSRVSQPQIPRQLHFIWVGPTIPEHLAANVRRWRELHPNWGCHVWSERDLRWLTNQSLFNEAESIVPRDAVGQFRSDVARYEIILRHGGFYADVDTYPLKPIDGSVLNHREFAVREDPTWIGNTYLGGRAGSPIFDAIITGLASNVKRNRGKRANVLSGPKYITPIWRNHDGYVAPTEWGFPYSYTHVKRGTVPTDFGDDTYVVHQWHHTKQVMEARHARR